MIVETHCHLDDERFTSDRNLVLDRLKAEGIGVLLNVGYDIDSSQRSVQLAEQHKEIYAAVGIHPHDAKDVQEQEWTKLGELAQHPKVVALGEMGLDYYRDLSPRLLQQDVFRRQLEMANNIGLPVIIHNRDAHLDVLEILKEIPPTKGGVLHCFSGSWETAQIAMKLGFYISFAGPLTYKNSVNLQEVAKKIPVERLLVETDSPYLSPEPLRGKRNEPANVKLVLTKLAELRSIDSEELASITTQNARNLFGF